MEDLTIRKVLAAGSAAWLAYHILKALYNISPLHPLSSIPGPKLAGATYLPEFYYDVLLGGRYTRAIKEMHDKYGPIVRISPNETHCIDLKFADEIFALGGRKRDKPLHQTRANGADAQSVFTTFDHDVHRIRRVPIAKFFSNAMIERLEGEVAENVDKLTAKMLAEAGKGPLDAATAYSCFSSDTISSYCFGEPFGLLDQKGWTPNFREATLAVLKPVFWFRFFPSLSRLAMLGEHFVDYLPADAALLIGTITRTLPSYVHKARSDLNAGIQYDRPTIIADLLRSDLEESEKTTKMLVDNAMAVVGAGTETTSWALAVITYHLLTKPDLMNRLHKEVSGLVKDPSKLPDWKALEELPFLTAVIQEGLRLSYGVSARTAREPSQEDLVYRGEFNKKPVVHVLPRGYAIGMSCVLSHHDETVFPNSYAFSPDRWLLEDGKRNRELEKANFAFAKGSRACLGKNLALCELNLVLAALTLRVFPRMKLYETTERDVLYDHDMFIPVVAAGSKGVRVTIE
ncbi:cytochrome P450 [Microdochium bolleyi]|uniref:Cytochrome P450 n=1 Tax=Microdochium bolleyi TaxID=196109 RepID=A0A136J8B1_9PEZI|nr:cytochrome P450 [Microdochium bolleyi]